MTKKAVLKKAAPKKAKTATKKPSSVKKKAVKKTATIKPEAEETEFPEIKKPVVTVKSNKSIIAIVGKIRERLLENRGEVLKMLESSQAMERDVDGLTFSNEIDLASSLEGREMVFHLSSRDRKELKLIDDALIKIENSTYGVCRSCEKMIGIKRLQILPLTALCIECQESSEHH
ncbi:MAG: TraR/DksA family transcriptional regulator [Nitrospirota bacterium]|nr:TraR/DksA family transcriptional regulator [Nitrospirota bacterium]